MTLNGYERKCGKNIGGVEKIAFVRTKDVAEVQYDLATQKCVNVKLKPNRSFAQYAFKEDNATYTQSLSRKAAVTIVKHSLSLLLERVDYSSLTATEQLANESDEGLIAIVKTASGETLLLGHTPKFGFERALRLVGSRVKTGKQPTDIAGVELKFEACNDSKAVVFECNQVFENI